MIRFLAPVAEMTLTGGYIYNKRISENWVNREELCYEMMEIGNIRGYMTQQGTDYDILNLDSLYLLDPLWPEVSFPGNRITLGMMHFLPSLNPLLPCREKTALQERENSFLSCLSGIITVSRFLATKLVERGFPKDMIRIVTPGIDPQAGMENNFRFSGTGGSSVFFTLAHLTPIKNQQWLLRVLEAIPDVEWKWRIAGRADIDPDYGERFVRSLKESPVKEQVHLLGSLDHDTALRELEKADLFIFPSLMESYGMACMEAVHAGTPVLASDAGGLSESVAHGKTGWLLPPLDTTAWKQFLRRFITGKERLPAADSETPVKFPSWQHQGRLFSSMVRELRECVP